ncbi:hypothetical protein OG914_06825 [Streptomyces sp. NBC_00291]|uniref:hypothetical protein n=1 Tax=Streptomyces sp. NBC_00291 TaxID=2975704 RepID=UPI002250CDF5|nr:hypothetical protein [Streptomyces sp. NBC_00291]MCX5153723.1 hypothetical protein [Streptomyces sp. NBC_00291]
MSPDFYVCEVVLWAGRNHRFPLREGWTATPRLAVRWLQNEAVRVAGLIDPDPDAEWLGPIPSSRLLVSPAPDVTDVPQALRDWADDAALHDTAMSDLSNRNPFHFHTRDRQTGVSLSALPVPVAFAADWDPFKDVSKAA